MTDLALYRGTETILLVDDEQMITDILKRILTKLGYRVFAFTNPCEALNFVTEDTSPLNLVITDMNMPGLNGLALSLKIKQLNRDLPVVLCSGYTNDCDQKNAVEAGIKSILKKPVDTLDLVISIRSILDAKPAI